MNADPTLTALHGALETVRNHVVGAVSGLSDEALRTTVLPSGWTCLGLLRHLALDVERFWFTLVMAGGLTAADLEGDDESAWAIGPETSAASVFDLYARERAAADVVIAATDLEAAPATWPEDLFGDFRLADLRAVLLHVITETACHAGHLDAAVELLDGRQWLVL